jgi:hypothetical protein
MAEHAGALAELLVDARTREAVGRSDGLFQTLGIDADRGGSPRTVGAVTRYPAST